MGDKINSLKFISDATGRVTDMAPFKPNAQVWLGTDQAGNSIRPITRRHQVYATYSCHHRNATCRDWLHFGSTARIFQQATNPQFCSIDSGRNALSTTVITRLYYHGQRIHQLFWRFRNKPIYTHNLPNFNHGCHRFTNYNQPNQQ